MSKGASSGLGWVLRMAVICLVLHGSGGTLVAQTSSPVQLKSAYIYNFLKYVTWQDEDSIPHFVYRAAYPQSSEEPITLERVATLGLSLVVAGDISPRGDEILLKTYDQVFYWSRRAGQPLSEALSADPLRVPYNREPQGEAVAWAADARGY